MTTIAIKNGFMVSDSRVTRGGGILGATKKVYDFGNIVVGVCGTLQDSTRFLKWIKGGKKRKFPVGENTDFDALVYHRLSGKVLLYASSDVGDAIDAGFYAIGSGTQYAIGAMQVGASAAEAIEVACMFDVYSGGVLQEVKL